MKMSESVVDTYWAANAIALTASLGWINGYPDGTFGPDKTVTRAELMAMVNRATDRRADRNPARIAARNSRRSPGADPRGNPAAGACGVPGADRTDPDADPRADRN